MGRIDRGLSTHIQQLRPWHRSMARAVVAGARPNELATQYGYTPAMITRIINSPLFKAAVARMEEKNEDIAVDVNADLKAMAPRAAEILDVELGEEDVEKLPLGERKHKVSVALSVLDRAGFGKKDQPLHLHKHAHVEVKDLSDEELYRDVLDLVESDG